MIPKPEASRAAWLSFYANLELATIPLRPREKRPLRKGWQTLGAAQWENAPADCNVGILTGLVSGGLVVLDFDTRDGPFEVLGLRPQELAARTLVVQTARGWHVYASDSDTRTRSPRGGLDIRGDGALVASPPSVHPSGAHYEILGPAESIARLDSFTSNTILVTRDPVNLNAPRVDLDVVDVWIAAQWPALREQWRRLRDPIEGETFDRSRADFAVARCLWEGGYSVEDVAWILQQLPGSKAPERGEAYATRTALMARREQRPSRER